MKLRFWFGLLLVCGAALQVQAKTFGNWSSNWSHGVTEYFLRGQGENYLLLSCPDGADIVPGVSVTIGGQPSPTGSRFSLTVDTKSFILRADDTALCPDCAKFADVWTALRAAQAVAVRFSDGRQARFSAKGGDKILGKVPCE